MFSVTFDSADGYWEQRRTAASVVVQTKMWESEEFGEAVENNFWLPPESFYFILSFVNVVTYIHSGEFILSPQLLNME